MQPNVILWTRFQSGLGLEHLMTSLKPSSLAFDIKHFLRLCTTCFDTHLNWVSSNLNEASLTLKRRTMWFGFFIWSQILVMAHGIQSTFPMFFYGNLNLQNFERSSCIVSKKKSGTKNQLFFVLSDLTYHQQNFLFRILNNNNTIR